MQPVLGAACISTKAAQKSIDCNIRKHLAAIVVLKAQRNQFALIYRLPPEIFCLIFSYVKKLSDDVRLPSCTYKKALEWIRVSHVSTHWRNIALNSPSLWDNPPLTNAIWTTEMLKRSQSGSLSAKVDFNAESSQKAVEGFRRVLNYGSRISHIAIRNAGPNERNLLHELPTSTPRLQVLSIHCSGTQALRHWSTALDKTPHNLCIPTAVLIGAGRKLWQLELANCRVSPALQFLPNITHLKLHDVIQTTKLTNIQFMDALCNMTRLESLDLKNVFPTRQNPGNQVTVKSHFAHLQHLLISSTSTDVGAFFRYATFPMNATVGITFQGQIMQVEAALTNIYQSYSSLADLDFRTLVVDSVQNDSVSIRTMPIQFQFFTEEFEDDPQARTYQDGCFGLTLDTWADEDMYEIDEMYIRFRGAQCISDVFNSGFPLGKISHVHLLDAIEFDLQSLDSSIGKLADLCFLRAVGRVGNSFLGAIQPLDNTNSTLSLDTILPLLSSIHFVGLEFADPDHCFDDDKIIIHQLEDFLIRRYEENAEISTLKLEDCKNLSHHEIDLLKEIIVDLRWDQIERGLCTRYQNVTSKYDSRYYTYNHASSTYHDDDEVYY